MGFYKDSQIVQMTILFEQKNKDRCLCGLYLFLLFGSVKCILVLAYLTKTIGIMNAKSLLKNF